MIGTISLGMSQPDKWIISRNQDLMWFQGSVIAGLLLLSIFLFLPGLNSTNYSVAHPAVLVLLLWGVMLDGTHVWATYARTYFAPDETSRAGIPKPTIWLVLGIGPLIAVIDHNLFSPGPSIVGQAGMLFRYFLAGAYLWAYYHLIRQHYGIMVLYNRKSGIESDGLDKIFLWVASIYPFARFSLTDDFTASGLPHVLPVGLFDEALIVLDAVFVCTVIALVLVFLSRQKGREFVFGPKHLFLLIVIGFHFLVFSTLSNLLAITATLTIFHNFQYHRIVWQYEQGKDRIPMGNVYRYLAIGLLFGLLWYGPRVFGVAASDTDLVRNILLGLGWSIAFHHYVVDSRIWRVRKNPAIAQTLDKGA